MSTLDSSATLSDYHGDYLRRYLGSPELSNVPYLHRPRHRHTQSQTSLYSHAHSAPSSGASSPSPHSHHFQHQHPSQPLSSSPGSVPVDLSSTSAVSALSTSLSSSAASSSSVGSSSHYIPHRRGSSCVQFTDDLNCKAPATVTQTAAHQPTPVRQPMTATSVTSDQSLLRHPGPIPHHHLAKSILTIPIVDEEMEVLAVLQMVNKQQGLDPNHHNFHPFVPGLAGSSRAPTVGVFDDDDVGLMLSFAHGAGLILRKAQMHDDLVYAQRKSSIMLSASMLDLEKQEVGVDHLIERILRVAYDIINPKRMALFFVDNVRQELYCMVSPDVKGFSLPLDKGIAGAVASTGEPLNIKDAYMDPRFDPTFDRKTGNPTVSVLCLPVKDHSGHTIAVIQAINKKLANGTVGHFTAQDQKLLNTFVREVGNTLCRHLTAVMLERQEIVQDQKVHSLLKLYGRDMKNPGSSRSHRVGHRRNPTGLMASSSSMGGVALGVPGSSSFFPDSVSSAGPGSVRTRRRSASAASGSSQGQRFPHPSPVQDSVDHKPKTDGASGTNKSSASFPSASSSLLVHVGNHRRSIDRKLRFRSPSATLHPAVQPHTEVVLMSLQSFDFNVWDYNEDDLLVFALLMLHDTDCIKNFDIPVDTLQNFLVAVRKKYRKNPYHNWYHGFSVMQFCYLVLRLTKAMDFLHKIDVLSLLLAALCHDIDHPGSNNGFEVSAHTELALMHNDISVLENHHAVTTFQLLRNSHLDIFKKMDPKTRQIIRKTMITGILSTDMQQHFDTCKKLDSMEPNCTSMDVENDADRQFMVDLVIHAADLSGQCFPNHIAKVWYDRVTEEFRQQVAREQELNMPVAPFMQNLDDPKVPARNQLNFIDFVMSPLWAGMVNLLPELAPCQHYLRVNRKYLDALSKGEASLTILSGETARGVGLLPRPSAPAPSQLIDLVGLDSPREDGIDNFHIPASPASPVPESPNSGNLGSPPTSRNEKLRVEGRNGGGNGNDSELVLETVDTLQEEEIDDEVSSGDSMTLNKGGEGEGPIFGGHNTPRTSTHRGSGSSRGSESTSVSGSRSREPTVAMGKVAPLVVNSGPAVASSAPSLYEPGSLVSPTSSPSSSASLPHHSSNYNSNSIGDINGNDNSSFSPSRRSTESLQNNANYKEFKQLFNLSSSSSSSSSSFPSASVATNFSDVGGVGDSSNVPHDDHQQHHHLVTSSAWSFSPSVLLCSEAEPQRISGGGGGSISGTLHTH